MAESSSSALPGGVEWLPTLGGAHLLRAEVRGEPPVLVLHTTEGEEHRIEPGPQARYDGTTTYMVPAGLAWSRASLMWPDGTRAVLPMQADVITLPRREPVARSLPAARAAAVDGAAVGRSVGHRGRHRRLGRPPGDVRAGAGIGRGCGRSSRGERARDARRGAGRARFRAGGRPGRARRAGRRGRRCWPGSPRSWTPSARRAARSRRSSKRSAPPTRRPASRTRRRERRSSRSWTPSETPTDRRAGRSTPNAPPTRRRAAPWRRWRRRWRPPARSSRPPARRPALEAVRAESLPARRPSSAADARAHLASARRDAALARAEVATLRADLEAERAARARAEAALREAGDGTAYLERVAKLDRDVEGLRTQVRLERRAREQAEAAAAAARRPPAETGRLLANLDAAAAALRATTEPLDDADPPVTHDATAPANGAAFAPAVPVRALPLRSPRRPRTAPLRCAGRPRRRRFGRRAPANGAAFGAARAPANGAASRRRGRRRGFARRRSASRYRLAGGAAAHAGATPAATAAAAARAAAEAVVAAALPGSADLVVAHDVPRRPDGARSPARRDRCLRLALVGLAAEDPVAAGTLLAGLLPAQGAVIEQTLTYDLTVRGIGTFAVFVADGAVRVQRISRPRGRGEAAFHLSAEPHALAELLAGDQRKIRRLGRSARYSGRRKKLRALAALPTATALTRRRRSRRRAARAMARLPRAAVRDPGRVDPRPRVHRRAGDRRAGAARLVHHGPRRRRR